MIYKEAAKARKWLVIFVLVQLFLPFCRRFKKIFDIAFYRPDLYFFFVLWETTKMSCYYCFYFDYFQSNLLKLYAKSNSTIFLGLFFSFSFWVSRRVEIYICLYTFRRTIDIYIFGHLYFSLFFSTHTKHSTSKSINFKK